MRILVTNDDGVSAPGLVVAEKIAAELAGPKGEVWVSAPAFEQSGVSHAISYTSPIQMEKIAERRFACAGTPADSVIIALSKLMENAPPDLVISGVNRGHNVAEDAVYSGTVGGAIEGALRGCKAIALSQFFRRGSMEQMFAPAARYGADVIRTLLRADWTPDLFFNVNFPPVGQDEAKGVRLAPSGRRRNVTFTVDERVSPGGRDYFWIAIPQGDRSTAPEADAMLCAQGWVTVTPMLPDYTDHSALERLNGLF